jgi:hypothetical protein
MMLSHTDNGDKEEDTSQLQGKQGIPNGCKRTLDNRISQRLGTSQAASKPPPFRYGTRATPDDTCADATKVARG